MSSQEAAALIEYAPEMRNVDELSGSSVAVVQTAESSLQAPEADRAEMHAVSPDIETHSPSGSSAVEVADPNYSVTPVDPKAILTLALDAESGEPAANFFENDKLVRKVAVRRELKGRMLRGYITPAEAAQIEAELLKNAGVHYRMPSGENELKLAVGFSAETPVSADDLRELLAVHVQYALGMSMETSTYLARIIRIVASKSE